MIKTTDLWALSYHLSGCTLLGATSQEPLGALPLPLRTAILALATDHAPARFKCVFNPPTQLHYEAAQHLTYRYWRTDPDDLLAQMANLEIDRTPAFPSAEAYFQHYPLHPNEADDQDEHWAERQFIERVFIPVCGLDGLRYLKPQVPFRDSRRIERRIDFVLDGAQRYALEIEGKTYHDGPDRFDREKARQRELLHAGFHYFPLTWSDIECGEAEPVLRGLIEQDPLLRPLLEPTAASDVLALAWLLVALPQHYPVAQRAALALLARATDRGLSQLIVAEVDGSLPIFTLALMDTLGLIERVADFYGIPVQLPELVAYQVTPRNPELQERLLQAMLQTDRVPEARLDVPRTAVHFAVLDALPDDLPDHAVILAEDRTAFPNARTFDDLDGWGRRFAARWPRPPERLPALTGLERPTLDYFTRRYFQVPELKTEQINLLQRLLRGQDALGILPTGFGKSLVFQLYAILSPRVTLVISPLKALIQDQIGALQRLGWTCVDSVLSTDTTEQHHRRLADLFRSSRYRLFYIAPERLQIKTFYDELRDTLHDTPLGALVIDEAHCVSEWGHDFRPAYLQIPRLRRLLEDSVQRRVPLLALTATASPPVREDLLETLKLVPNDLQQTTNSDRRNLSLSVHPVPAQEGAKSQALARLLIDDLPRALQQPLGFDAFMEVEAGRYPDAGIVFAMYADPHGKTTFTEGTAQIAAQLRQTLGLTEKQVQTHASRVPKVCPQCGSHDYWKATPEEARQAQVSGPALMCRNCYQVFLKPKPVADWDKALQQRHQAFQQDQFPLLVATKGFGMGIDKRNVSFVVHHAFASGLEGYYQEAGRAGRANQRAHVALLYIPPTDACLSDTIDQGEMPHCMADPNSFKYRCCPRPYNLKVLCDFSHQARFIQDSYPGVETDCETTYAVYKRLKAGQPLASQDDSIAPTRDDNLTDTPDSDRKKTVYELALYRLQQLGIVQGYTLEYFGLKKWRFEIDCDLDWRPSTLLAHVQDFLERSRRAPTEDLSGPLQILHDLAADCGAPPWPAEHRRPEIMLLKKAIGTLLRRVYERVRAMRLQMLRNELDYVRTTGEGACRRVTLINLFSDKTHQVPDDYRCGLCDVCAPNLHFTQELATDAVGNVDLEELVWRLNDFFQAPELETTALHTFIQQIQERGVILGMLARATRHLEGDPNSLPALYLAGALSWRAPARQNQALGYFRTGFQEGQHQGLGEATLLRLFYRAGAEVDADEAVRWLNKLLAPLTSPAALWSWLESREPLLGRDSPAWRALAGITKVRALQGLSGPIQELKSLANWIDTPPERPHRILRHILP